MRPWKISKKVEKLFETYVDTGIKEVSVKLYPDKRHELLNEDIRDQVMFDALNFLNSCVIKSNCEDKENNQTA